MKTLILLTSSLLSISFLSSCSSGNVTRVYHSRNSEAGRAIAQMDKAEQDFYVRRERQLYLGAAQLFVKESQKGDVNAMLELTSDLTLKISGRDATEEIYTTQVIPEFKGTKVLWNQPTEVVSDDTGNRGYIITGKATGERSFPVYITVMKERGSFRVITIAQQR